MRNRMVRRRGSVSPALGMALAALLGFFVQITPAATYQALTLDVQGDTATIVRDEYGRPHIFAKTNRGLFEAYGYAVAEDRMFQMDLNRRAARGRLSEVTGPGSLDADKYARTVGYSDAELDAQFTALTEEEQEIYIAYRDGINRYITEVIVPDLVNKLPFEYHILQVGVPEAWTLRDSVAFGAYMTRRFGEIGGRALRNQDLLNKLITDYGEDEGYAIFNDVRWLNDPDAPVTIRPDDLRAGERQGSGLRKSATFNKAQLLGASEPWSDLREKAQRIWESWGVPTKLGSYGWVVSAEHSAEGTAMLYGGPQMGFSAPEVLHEVQLKGGNGLNVTGMAFAGVPGVLIGRNESMAWTSTTATGGNLDIYIEKLCDGGNGTVFNGACRPFERRTERINVRGGDPLEFTVRRTVHGPVVSMSDTLAVSEKRAHWMRETESIGPFMAFSRAHSVEEFDKAVRQIVTSHNFFYADQEGNIAYWQAGQVPIRPEGFDPRLPFPGDGRAEWPGGTRPVPVSINPARGWLANWNNKPTVDYDNADEQILGKQFRLLDLEDRLAPGPVSLEDMRDIPKDIARFAALGREARFLKPYLLESLYAVPSNHPLAAQAREVLEAWDGNGFPDAVSSQYLEPGEVIFSKWLGLMRENTFRPTLGDRVGEAGTNMLIHVLDDVLGGGSGVPPSRDYFNGADPYTVISNTFTQALAALGPDPAAWSTQARSLTVFRHPVLGPVAQIPQSNRATYGQIAVLDPSEIYSENIFTLGQSGFIRFVPPAGFELDPHYSDQLDLYQNFQYKPMVLLPQP